jgi:hypothetical protein
MYILLPSLVTRTFDVGFSRMLSCSPWIIHARPCLSRTSTRPSTTLLPSPYPPRSVCRYVCVCVCVCVYLLLCWPRAGLDQPRLSMGLASRRLLRTVVAYDIITSGECRKNWFVLLCKCACVCVFSSVSVEYEFIRYNSIKIDNITTLFGFRWPQNMC